MVLLIIVILSLVRCTLSPPMDMSITSRLDGMGHQHGIAFVLTGTNPTIPTVTIAPNCWMVAPLTVFTRRVAILHRHIDGEEVNDERDQS